MLDSSDPDYVRGALGDHLEQTVVVVSSKSGGTVETDSQKRAYEQAFRDADCDPAAHIVVVTDPGSPLDESATEAGYRVFHADPDVGGRYSRADRVRAGAERAGRRRHRPAARRGGRDPAPARGRRRRQPGAAARRPARRSPTPRGVDKVVLADNGLRHRRLRRLGRAADRRVDRQERQGHPAGRRTLPGRAELLPQHRRRGAGDDRPGAHTDAPPASGWGAAVDAPLGAQMLLWEYATAVAGRLIGINPFDQPDVESAKQAARDMLEGGPGTARRRCSPTGPSRSTPPSGLLVRESTVADAVATLLGRIDGEHGYLAVMAYLDRARRRPTWPRCASASPSGPAGRPPSGGGRGSCTPPGSTTRADRRPASTSRSPPSRSRTSRSPGRPFTFGGFISAQAVGDASVLADHGRPVLRLHLTDQTAGLDVLRETLR